MTTPAPEPQHTPIEPRRPLKDHEFIGPGKLGYDLQVLKVSRQITFTSVVPIKYYPGMTVPEAVAHEYNLEFDEVMELLQFLDEKIPGQSIDLRTHVDVVVTGTTSAPEES